MKTAERALSGGASGTAKVPSRDGARSHALSAAFGAYVVLLIAAVLVLPRDLTSGWYDVTMVRWIVSGYAVLGALVLACVCTGAVALQSSWERRLGELRDNERRMRFDLRRAARSEAVLVRPREAGRASAGPSDEDVEQLLLELGDVTQMAGAAAIPDEELAARLDHRITPAGLRLVQGEIQRLEAARSRVAAAAVGPAIASIGFLGVCAALLPGAEGVLQTSDLLRTLIVVGGLGCFLGLPAYAAAVFSSLGRGVRSGRASATASGRS